MLRTGYSNVKQVILSYQEAAQLAQLYNRQPQRRIMEGTDIRAVLPARPVVRQPAVAILGHKDHGKTTLLDALRGTSVAAREEFGITQETYTYEVTLDEATTETERQRFLAGTEAAGKRRTFTFLDTPGHHSFTEMRAQAAAHADLIVLVVAADEGLLEQTFECLNIITEFRVPVIVALSKVDKEGAAAIRIRRELQRLGARLLTADRPTASVKGEMVAVELSAKTGKGMELLRRALFGVTELLPLAADANAPCSGGVVEAWREEKRRGEVVRLLVKQGTLRVGDWLVADTCGGRIKAMHDMRRRPMKQCVAGQVCEVMGVEGLPPPGREFFVCSKEAMEAITEVRRLEQEYPEQPRLQKKPREAAEEEEEAQEVEDGHKDENTVMQEATSDRAAEEATAPTAAPLSHRVRSAAPSYFSPPTPRPARPAVAPAPRAYDELVAADDYNPLPVVIKANSVGQLHMVSGRNDICSVHSSEFVLPADPRVRCGVVCGSCKTASTRSMRSGKCVSQANTQMAYRRKTSIYQRVSAHDDSRDNITPTQHTTRKDRAYTRATTTKQAKPATNTTLHCPPHNIRPQLAPDNTQHTATTMQITTTTTSTEQKQIKNLIHPTHQANIHTTPLPSLPFLCPCVVICTALIQVIHSTVGSITKTDIQYAQAYECPIYCFCVKRPLRHEQRAIDKLAVHALYYSHHQHLIDEIERNMVREYERRKGRAAEVERRAAEKARGGGLAGRGTEEGVGREGEEGEEEAERVVSSVEGVDEDEDEVEDDDEDDGREEWERFTEPSQLPGEQRQAEGHHQSAAP